MRINDANSWSARWNCRWQSRMYQVPTIHMLVLNAPLDKCWQTNIKYSPIYAINLETVKWPRYNVKLSNKDRKRRVAETNLKHKTITHSGFDTIFTISIVTNLVMPKSSPLLHLGFLSKRRKVYGTINSPLQALLILLRFIATQI